MGEPMKRTLLIVGCMTLGMTISACGNVGEGDVGGSSSPSAKTQMALTVDIDGDTDVAGFRFKARRVSCQTGKPMDASQDGNNGNGYTYTAEESLEEATIPGHNGAFENRPYDEQSKHRFADHLFTVPAGCYDLTATPIDEHGDVSEDCATAKLEHKRVYEQTSNEFHLISQCRGQARTTLDVMASLNHPPEATLQIQKFMCAGAGVHVCATAYDPDGDPLRFEWKGTTPGCFIAIPDGEPHRDRRTGKVTQCVTIPSDIAKNREYKVVVKDLAWDKKRCKLEPIEELLPKEYAKNFDASKSRATLYFPVHQLGDCIAGASTFIGVTLGANLCSATDQTDCDRGMSEKQAKTLASNSVDFVNPNRLGDADPRILLVRDTANDEDKFEAAYIKRLLSAKGYHHVTLIDEPDGGLRKGHTIGFKIVWLVNPGWPIDDGRTIYTLKWFRKNGGGVILSGDDANQIDLSDNQTDLHNTTWHLPSDMRYFSGLEYLGDNGEHACGQLTDNNQGKNYKVRFKMLTPLTQGLDEFNFPYGNDIDRNKLLYHSNARVAAFTRGLTCDHDCLPHPVPVITYMPSPLDP